MPKFIRLTNRNRENRDILVNPDHITLIQPNWGGSLVTVLGCEFNLDVAQTPYSITHLIVCGDHSDTQGVCPTYEAMLADQPS